MWRILWRMTSGLCVLALLPQTTGFSFAHPPSYQNQYFPPSTSHSIRLHLLHRLHCRRASIGVAELFFRDCANATALPGLRGPRKLVADVLEDVSLTFADTHVSPRSFPAASFTLLRRATPLLSGSAISYLVRAYLRLREYFTPVGKAPCRTTRASTTSRGVSTPGP